MPEEIIEYLLRSWHHIALLIVAFVTFIIVEIKWIVGIIRRSPDTHASPLSHITLVIVCLIAIDNVIEGYHEIKRGKKPHQHSPKGIELRIKNKYAKDFLEDLNFKVEQITNKEVKTTDIHETTRELLRAINNTDDSLFTVNHYIEGWNKPPLSTYYLANIEAIRKRNVKIKRIFIISDNVLNDPQRMQDAMNLMDLQKNNDINVFVALENELMKESQYQKLALRNSWLFDKSLLVSDIASSPGQSVPALIKFTWDSNEIEEKSPFFYLEKSLYVHEYTPKRRKILELILSTK